MLKTQQTRQDDTPWGRSDGIIRLDANITVHDTPSHGGIKVKDEKDIPAQFRKEAHGWPGWYEEDCDAAIVVIFHPDLFPLADLNDVLLNLYAWNRDVYEYITDCETPVSFPGCGHFYHVNGECSDGRNA